MTTDQARLFLTIVETGSFTEAAARHDMTQSAASKQIRALEDELGFALLDRSHRHATPTEFGRRVLPRCRRLCDTWAEILRQAEAYAGERSAGLRLTAVPILSQYGFTEQIDAFAAAHPDLRIVQRESEEAGILEALRTNACDLAIVRAEAVEGTAFRMEPVATDELCLFVRKDHPLAMRAAETGSDGSDRVATKARNASAGASAGSPDGSVPPVSAGDLAGLPILLMPRHTGVTRLAMRFFEAAGVRPEIKQHARIETILGAVEAGPSGAMLMRQVGRVFRTDAVVALAVEPTVRSTVVAVYSRVGERNPMAQALVRQLKARAGALAVP